VHYSYTVPRRFGACNYGMFARKDPDPLHARHFASCSATGTATLIAPFWTSSSWWNLLAPNEIHFPEFVVDWTWITKEDSALFFPGQNNGN
jgi:hypothetical protein